MTFDKFLSDYLICASWTNDDVPISVKAKGELEKKARAFYDANEVLIVQWEDCGYSAGHDLWLTQNHHGAGFWDRASTVWAKELGNTLTKLAHDAGEVELYEYRGKLFI